MTETFDAAPTGDDIEALLAAERPRLVSLCARLSGDASMAEDLAQETLTEAWRLLGRLRQLEGLSSWLSAIARNICLRWARKRGRDLAQIARLAPSDGGESDSLDILPAGDGDLTVALVRDELVALLDRALALLPADTRAALVGSYIDEMPQAELAIRLGLSAGALRVRLHRGRLALRRALASDLRDEADALGLALPENGLEASWRQTRIWCPFCGRHTLEFRIDGGSGSSTYRCVGRCVAKGVIAGWTFPPVGALSSPKPMLTRHCLMLDRYYRDTLASDQGTCARCGAALRVYRYSPDQPLDPLPHEFGIVLVCPTCGPQGCASAWHLTLDTAEAQRFWRRHQRMRALPVREVEAEGRPALISGFESADGQARLVIVSDRQTYQMLRVYGERDKA